MGQRGIEYWKRDNKNRLTERLEKGKFDTAAIAGDNMHLALDIELQALGEKLIDIHSQHATAEINDPEFQLLVVDAVARHDDLLNEYRSKFKAYKKATAKLQQLTDESEKAKADLDYHQFQFDELEKSKPGCRRTGIAGAGALCVK